MDIKIDSTKETNDNLVNEIRKALKNIRWGSLEIYVQDSKIVQITERNIKKIPHSLSISTHKSKSTGQRKVLRKNGS